MTNTKALELAKRIDAEFSQVMMDSEGTAREGNTGTLAWAVIDLSTQLVESDAQLMAMRELVSTLGWSLMVAKPAQERVLKGVQLVEHYEKTAYADICRGYDAYLSYKATRQPTQDKGE